MFKPSAARYGGEVVKGELAISVVDDFSLWAMAVA
jgi:hypothetical protein